MTQDPPTSRSIPPRGVLAGSVLVLGLLSLGASLSADSPAPDQPPRCTGDVAGNPVSPALGRPMPPPSGEALRHSHVTHGGLDLHAQSGVLPVARGGTPRTALPDWLAVFRGRRPPCAHPSLHVLFCTWLT